jgi:hypothetical protein
VCNEILLPYFADTEKVRFLLSTGQYARKLPGTIHAPANGTRFNVQDFFMGLAQHRECPSELLSPALREKLQDLPMYEALAAKWVEDAAEPEAPVPAEPAR